jgi:hypothetical protein
VLDNHIQMQYELIAKQLTLLRDEVGPGERLVFLELPHSIYTTPGKAEEKLAQVWWHIDGCVRVDETVKRLADLEETRSKLKAILYDTRRSEYERLSKDIDIKVAEIKNRQLVRLVEQSQRIIQGGAEDQSKLLNQISLIQDAIRLPLSTLNTSKISTERGVIWLRTRGKTISVQMERETYYEDQWWIDVHDDQVARNVARALIHAGKLCNPDIGKDPFAKP